MPKFTIEKILESIEKYVDCYISEDVLPVTIAIADPKKITIGVSIQQNYPLGMIHREYGLPYAHIKGDLMNLIYDIEQLHRMKMQLEVHEAVFEIDAINDLVLQQPEKKALVVTTFSTGLGNLLQNRECIAFTNNQKGSKFLYYVDGQEFDDHPFPCLVAYSKDNRQDSANNNNTNNNIGVELLLFNSSGDRCNRIDSSEFFGGDAALAFQNSEENFEDKIIWAVSGYPLIMNGTRIQMEDISKYVSDYRHIWTLPMLNKSLIQRIKNLKPLSDFKYKDKIEFFYGFYRLSKDNFLRSQAVNNQVITMPLHPQIGQEWLTQMCNICQISGKELKEPHFKQPEKEEEKKWVFQDKSKQIFWDKEDLEEDFKNAGYQRVNSKNLVQQEGQFHIDSDDITLKLKPAIYPHHIVGMTKGISSRLVNISIGGLSGRSGITIENAQKLCEEIGLRDAIIFDNGNDVISRITKGPVFCHKSNTRQTRLTAALHFGCEVDSMFSGSDFEGFEVAYKTLKVGKQSNQASQSITDANSTEYT